MNEPSQIDNWQLAIPNKKASGSQNVVRSVERALDIIRNRYAKPQASRAELDGPNCGAPLKVNVSAVCAFCGGKITSGEFDWVLSRIEQDESYVG